MMFIIIGLVSFFGWLAISYKHIKRKTFGSDDHKKAIEKNDVTHIGIYTHDNGLQCVLFAGY